jgi:inner membrane protein
MDNVSHTLVGAALGQAGLKKMSGLGVATLMIAANIPDLDVIAIPFGENLTFRRGWTHGPIGLLVLPAMLAVCMVGFDRWQTRRGTRPASRLPVAFWPVALLAYIGALTHPFLDWLNSYGIRFLMPFSHEWFYGDALFIVDPWLWLMMLTGIILSRRRERNGRLRPELPSMIALALLIVYIGGMLAGSRYAESVVRTEAPSHGVEQIESMMAGPVPVNPLRREVIINDGSTYYTGSLELFGSDPLMLDEQVVPINRGELYVEHVLSHPDVGRFLYWSRFPYFVVDSDSSAAVVSVHDLRFSRRAGGGWASVSVSLNIAPLDTH